MGQAVLLVIKIPVFQLFAALTPTLSLASQAMLVASRGGISGGLPRFVHYIKKQLLHDFEQALYIHLERSGVCIFATSPMPQAAKTPAGWRFFYGKQRLAEEIIACCVVFRKQPNLAKFAVTHFQ